ncbi:lytic transglycosylase domain-containing protein [Dyella tabacisoli]|uniref:Lytic transglycosylase domain-containing protein n=1 Tax=Dyella tabacisoli TaxID=2282381 RepID=A0A369UR86_9GAMM|nr:lytic transglycosylase domain-containing protein [Dyella tabacisoli]RDD82813.1 lytic transglycosylase domain-containing protein [Dyella tabacisoli]
MLTGMEMMACPNLAVPAEVMHHIVNVESSQNPYAIGVVGGQLVRQPQNLGEAIATVHMLETKGYNFSLGLAQVNRSNLGKYGLDSYEKAFETCPNLSAGSRILAECYANSGGDWGKSFSCYYSGNFVTGYRDGYVQKIYDSMNRSVSNTAAAIPLQLIGAQTASRGSTKPPAPITSDSGAYRVAIRSVLLDTATSMAVVPPLAAASAPATTTATVPAVQAPPAQTTALAATSAQPAPTAATANAAAEVFVPKVRGPNDPVPSAAPADTAPSQVAASPTVSASASDQADLRQGNRDAAFVF